MSREEEFEKGLRRGLLDESNSTEVKVAIDDPIIGEPPKDQSKIITAINPMVIFAEEGYEAHWNETISDFDYHSDKTAVNSSSLKKMLKSPKAFYASYFLSQNEEPTQAMKFGTLAHMAILEGEKFRERYVLVPDFGDMRSKTNREKKAAWMVEQPAGAVLCTAEERDSLFAMIDSILSHEQAHKLLSQGKPEIAGYWRDDETGLRLRMKADFLSFNVNALVDVKTTQDTVWEEFRRSVEKLRYDIQIMMYDDGTEKITRIRPDHRVWLAVESKMPFEVACFEVPPQYEATGKHEYRRALRRIAECAKANAWPQRQAEIEYGEMSPWFYKQYELQGAFDDIVL